MDPYVYPGTNVLINKLNIQDATKLTIVEGRLFALKSLEPLPIGNFDYEHLKAIHQHFFSDIYAWAGQERTIDIAKQDSYFAHTSYITNTLNKLFKELKEELYLQNLAKDDFCKRLSYYFNEINAAHPFREGNGRAQRAFCELLAEHAGYHLDWKILLAKKEIYQQANIQGFLHGNYEPMEKIFITISQPLPSTHMLKKTTPYLTKSIIKNIAEYVDKQVQLIEVVRQRNYSLVHDQIKAKQIGEQAVVIINELKNMGKEMLDNKNIQYILKQPSNTSLKKQGGFSTIQERLNKNEMRLDDFLAVLRYAQSNKQNISQSYNQEQNKDGKKRS